MIKVLIVDDEKAICDLIDMNLSAAGYVCKTVQDGLKAIDMIENDYDDKEFLPPELEGCIFNHLGTEDVAYYLADRYGKHVDEQIIYKYTLYK